MATTDELRRLDERFHAGMAGYDKEDHPPQHRWELGELLLEDQLSLAHKLYASTVLAARGGGLFPRDTYRLEAEQKYIELSAIVSGNVSDPENRKIEERYLANARKALDALAENQRRDDPRTRAAEESTTGPTKNGQITEE